MSDVKGGQHQEKAAKVRRKPEQESVLQHTFAASRHNTSNSLRDDSRPQGNNLLQRHCACGVHTIAGGTCDACRRKRESGFLQRAAVTTISDNLALNVPAEVQTFSETNLVRDFSRIPLHTTAPQGAIQPKRSTPFTPASLAIQRDPETPIVHESEFFVHGIFIQIDYDNTQVSPDQIRQLLRSLELIHPDHVQHVPTITVGNRPPRGGGGSAHSGMPGGPYIRLNKNCFNSSWNRGAFNETLLHEVGHIVDWAYDCMRHMRREDRAGYRALLNHPHRGRTQGPGEHFADAYAAYYLGRSMSRVREAALLHSRAFQV